MLRRPGLIRLSPVAVNLSVSASTPIHAQNAGRRTPLRACNMEHYCTMTVTMDHPPDDLTGPSWHDLMHYPVRYSAVLRDVRCAKPRPQTLVL
jgi:hypothetical protein